jgi:hypothetical protein
MHIHTHRHTYTHTRALCLFTYALMLVIMCARFCQVPLRRMRRQAGRHAPAATHRCATGTVCASSRFGADTGECLCVSVHVGACVRVSLSLSACVFPSIFLFLPITCSSAFCLCEGEVTAPSLHGKHRQVVLVQLARFVYDPAAGDKRKNGRAVTFPSRLSFPTRAAATVQRQLSAVICHTGASAHGGHYIAYVRTHAVGPDGYHAHLTPTQHIHTQRGRERERLRERGSNSLTHTLYRH